MIVRVYGLEDSFERDIPRLTGADIEQGAAIRTPEHDHREHGGGPGASDAGHGMAAGPRIRSSAVLLSAGGLDDHPLFARALLDRARALSRDPRRETVILTAHGTNEDSRNDRWLEVLESLAERMRRDGGGEFRKLRVATWREDWPAKRAPWVKRVRRWVEEAARDGGTAIVIPARTTAVGPEARLLKGLDYRLGSGFAPHPLFAQWFEEQVQRAIAAHSHAAHSMHVASETRSAVPRRKWLDR